MLDYQKYNIFDCLKLNIIELCKLLYLSIYLLYITFSCGFLLNHQSQQTYPDST